MSSKKKNKDQQPIDEKTKIPLMRRPKFNLIYTILIISFFSLGIILLILSYSIWQDYGFTIFIALGVLGVGIILLAMRSSYKSTVPEKEKEEKKKEDKGLQMRNR